MRPRPPALLLAAAAQGAEAAVLLAAAVLSAVDTAAGRSYQRSSGIALTVIAFGAVAVVAFIAWRHLPCPALEPDTRAAHPAVRRDYRCLPAGGPPARLGRAGPAAGDRRLRWPPAPAQPARPGHRPAERGAPAGGRTSRRPGRPSRHGHPGCGPARPAGRPPGSPRGQGRPPVGQESAPPAAADRLLAGRRPARRAAAYSSVVRPSRSWVRVRASRRETCIWEIPSSAAICDWVRLPKNRSSRIFFSRRRQPLEQRLERLPVLDALERLIDDAERVGDGGRVFVPGVGCVQGHRGVGVRRLQALQHVFLAHPQVRGELADGRRASLALSEFADGLGQRELELLQPSRHADRPALVPEVPLDLAHDGRASRRWRTPRPRSRSNRSIDLIRPMVATCVRSSSHSPRLRNRRARYSTSGRCSSTSAPRIRSRSGLPSGRAASRSNSSLARARSGTAWSSRATAVSVSSAGRAVVLFRHPDVLFGHLDLAFGHPDLEVSPSGPRRPAVLPQHDGHPVVRLQPRVDVAGQRGQHGPGERVPGRRCAAARRPPTR